MYPLKTKNTEEVRETFQGLITDFGTPHTVLLDSGGEFTSHSFKEFCRRRGLTLVLFVAGSIPALLTALPWYRNTVALFRTRRVPG